MPTPADKIAQVVTPRWGSLTLSQALCAVTMNCEQEDMAVECRSSVRDQQSFVP